MFEDQVTGIQRHVKSDTKSGGFHQAGHTTNTNTQTKRLHVKDNETQETGVSPLTEWKPFPPTHIYTNKRKPLTSVTHVSDPNGGG